MTLDAWQIEELYWALAESGGEEWAAHQIGLIVARQNGKNVIVEVRELFGLVVLGERILHTAHLFSTARESYNRLRSLVDGHPDVRNKLIDEHASPASGYDMVFAGGGRIQYIARSRTSGRGFDGIDLLVFDEAQDLNDDAQGALLPTISSKPNAQAWYQGSAPGVGSTVMHRIRGEGRSGVAGDFSYGEYSAEPDSDLDDRNAWRQANPSHRISDNTIIGERRAMSDEMFARERLSVSPDPLEAGGPFGDSWGQVCDPEASVSRPAVFAIDVNPDRNAGGIVGFGDGIVSVVEYGTGIDWIVDRCVALKEKYNRRFALDARGPAGSLIEELKRRKVRLVELDSTEMTRGAGAFFDAVTDKTITVRQNDDLDRAVSGAEKRSSGDAWSWGRKSSRVDITLLVAATAAFWAANQPGGPSKFFTAEELYE